MIRNKDHIRYDIQPKAVRMYYHNQVIIFNRYNAPSKQKFDKFRSTILNSRRNRYDNLNDVYRLAGTYHIIGTGGYYMTIHKTIAY